MKEHQAYVILYKLRKKALWFDIPFNNFVNNENITENFKWISQRDSSHYKIIKSQHKQIIIVKKNVLKMQIWSLA